MQNLLVAIQIPTIVTRKKDDGLLHPFRTTSIITYCLWTSKRCANMVAASQWSRASAWSPEQHPVDHRDGTEVLQELWSNGRIHPSMRVRVLLQQQLQHQRRLTFSMTVDIRPGATSLPSRSHSSVCQIHQQQNQDAPFSSQLFLIFILENILVKNHQRELQKSAEVRTQESTRMAEMALT